MGRGASRSKSGGMTVMKDAERKIYIKNNNVSLFEFLQDGCFEKDFVAYCSSRLNDYSCVHWLDPDTSEGDHLLQESQNMTSDDDDTFCWHDREPNTYFLMQFNQIAVPFEGIFAILCCILTLYTLRRVAALHPLVLYIIYIAIFDATDIFIRGGDQLLEFFGNIRVIQALQIMSRSSCQMLPFAYNLFKHCQMTLYVALAIDNWRFVKDPRRTNERYKPEWIRNVVIVIVALLITLNSQFFWTFDVAENDSLILHQRYVKNTFECSFSKTWPLKQSFTEFVWPIIDHFTGELLPTIIPLYFGLLYLKAPKIYSNELNRYIIKLDLLIQMNKAVFIICTIFGIISIPRLSYYIFKFIYFYYLKSTRSATKETAKSRFLITNISRKLNSLEKVLQNFEFFMQHVNILFVILKFFILFKNVDFIRNKTLDFFSICCRRNVNNKNRQNSLIVTNSGKYRFGGGSQGVCSNCSNAQCRCRSEDVLTFRHKSVSFKHPTESLTLCSYNM